MKKYILTSLVLISTIFFILCYINYTKKPTKVIDNNLLRFEEIYVNKINKYEDFKSHLKKPVEINVKYVEEYIIATTYVLADECLFTTANIEYKNDSIILKCNEIPAEETCGGLEIRKLNYIIKNTERKKYKFGYKGVAYHYHNEF